MRLFQFIAGALSAFGAIAAAVGVWFQYAAYREEEFVRRYGAISLAWNIVKDGNGTDHDIGQGAALQFLASERQLFGNISLVNSFLFSSIIDSGEDKSNLSSSIFCGTTFIFVSLIDANLRQSNFSNSVLLATMMSGARAYGARFDRAHLTNVHANDASFVGASFNFATLHGGQFAGADFSGADMRNIISIPLMSGGKSRHGADPFDREISNAEALSAVEPNLPLAADDSIGTPVDFTGAIFHHADIRHADLRNTNITQLQVDSACADATTQLPIGIVPKSLCQGEDWVATRRRFLQATAARRANPPPECSPESAKEP